MSATPGLKTEQSAGLVGLVTIANAYGLSGPLGLTPDANVAVNGGDPAFQQPTNGLVPAAEFSGRVVAIGTLPDDNSGVIGEVDDSTFLRITSTGASSFTMPTNPWDGMEIDVKAAAVLSGGDSQIITIAANTGQFIELVDNPGRYSASGGSTTLVEPSGSLRFRYQESFTAWQVVARSTPESRIVQGTAAGTVALTGAATVFQATGTGTSTVLLPAQPARGTRVTVKDISGNALSDNINVVPTGGDTIEQHTGGAPGSVDHIATNWQGVTWAYDDAFGVWRAVGKLL